MPDATIPQLRNIATSGNECGRGIHYNSYRNSNAGCCSVAAASRLEVHSQCRGYRGPLRQAAAALWYPSWCNRSRDLLQQHRRQGRSSGAQETESAGERAIHQMEWNLVQPYIFHLHMRLQNSLSYVPTAPGLTFCSGPQKVTDRSGFDPGAGTMPVSVTLVKSGGCE